MKHLAMAVVIRNGKVLIQERYRAEQGMVMEFPGGEANENESGTDAAIRELYEETHLSGLSHLATYSDINEYGGRIYYVVLHANESAVPVAHDKGRQQTFYWMSIEDIPTHDFYKADVNFIQRHLKKHLRRESKELV